MVRLLSLVVGHERSVWARLAWLCLSVATVALFAAEAWLLASAVLPEQVADYIPDEVLFYNRASNYRLSEGFTAGYGYLFWLLASTFLRCSTWSFATNLIILRISSLTFKYLAFVSIALAVRRLRGGLAGGAFYAVMLLTPAFYFYGKVFSPEYLLLFLTALAIYLLTRDEGRLGGNFFAAVAAVIAALATKLTVAPLGLLFVAYIWRYRSRITLKTFLLAAIVVAVALCLNGLPLLTSAGRAATIETMRAYSTMSSFGLGHLKNWYHMDFRTWDQIPLGGLRVDFTPLLICGGVSLALYLLVSALAIASAARRKAGTPGLPLVAPGAFAMQDAISTRGVKSVGGPPQTDSFLSAALLATGGVMIALVCFRSVSLYWYLFPAYLVTMAGLFGLCGTKPTVILTLLIVATVTPPRIYWRMADRATHNAQLDANFAASERISRLILDRYPDGGLVLTDILVAYRPVAPLEVIRFWEVIPKDRRGPFKNLRFIITNSQVKESLFLTILFDGSLPKEFVRMGEVDGLVVHAKQ